MIRRRSRDPDQGDGGLVVIACCLALLVTAGACVDGTRDAAGIRALLARPHRTLGDPTEGPGIYQGILNGPAGRRTLLGNRVAAALVQRVSATGKTKPRCQHLELDGLTLGDGQRQLALRLQGDVRTFPAGDSREKQREAFLADLSASAATLWLDAVSPEETAPSIPDGATAWCAASATGKGLQFHEQAVSAGIRVTASMCRAGNELHGCDQPGDFISTDGPHSIADRYRQNAMFRVLAVWGIGAALTVALGLWLSFKHRAAGRSR